MVRLPWPIIPVTSVTSKSCFCTSPSASAIGSSPIRDAFDVFTDPRIKRLSEQAAEEEIFPNPLKEVRNR